MALQIAVMTPVKRRKVKEIQDAIDQMTAEKARLQDDIREALWENEPESDIVRAKLRYNAELSTRIAILRWVLGETL